MTKINVSKDLPHIYLLRVIKFILFKVTSFNNFFYKTNIFMYYLKKDFLKIFCNFNFSLKIE